MATESDNRTYSLAATPPADYPIARHRTHGKQLMKAANELVREGKRVRGSNAAYRCPPEGCHLNPNPPKDTDGRREDRRRGMRELQGRWPGLDWGRWEVGGGS